MLKVGQGRMIRKWFMVILKVSPSYLLPYWMLTSTRITTWWLAHWTGAAPLSVKLNIFNSCDLVFLLYSFNKMYFPCIFRKQMYYFWKKMLKQWMIARSHVKINAVYFKKWLTATFSVTKINTLLQRKHGCN